MGPGQYGVYLWFRHIWRKCLFNCHNTFVHTLWDVRKLHTRKKHFEVFDFITMRATYPSFRLLQQEVLHCKGEQINALLAHVQNNNFSKKAPCDIPIEALLLVKKTCAEVRSCDHRI